jgi:hypothetical protein
VKDTGSCSRHLSQTRSREVQGSSHDGLRIRFNARFRFCSESASGQGVVIECRATWATREMKDRIRCIPKRGGSGCDGDDDDGGGG